MPNSAATIHHYCEALDLPELLTLNVASAKWPVPEAISGRVQYWHRVLARRGIELRHSLWVSTEWFVPTGRAGIAVPFYLCHPKLFKLARQYGVDEGEHRPFYLDRLIAHELGHVVDHAFQLFKNPDWQQVFGNPFAKYPTTYRPRIYSADFVKHLGDAYAQAHPAEDFAETFAVWLGPKQEWRQRYCKTRALKKLEFVDDLMKSIRGLRQKVDNDKPMELISRSSFSIAQILNHRWRERHMTFWQINRWLEDFANCRARHNLGSPSREDLEILQCRSSKDSSDINGMYINTAIAYGQPSKINSPLPQYLVRQQLKRLRLAQRIDMSMTSLKAAPNLQPTHLLKKVKSVSPQQFKQLREPWGV